jgi:hypothetical protein
MSSLIDAREWNKLECWTGVIWIMWPQESDDTAEALKSATTLLFRPQPGAIPKLTGWIEKWAGGHPWGCIPRSFQQICEQERLKME